MIADRYMKTVLTVIAVALLAIAVRPWLPQTPWTSMARPQPAYAQVTTPKYEVTVPKAWGKFIGFSNNNLLLESSDGMRIVDVEGKPPEYPKVKVHVRFQ